MSSKECRHGCHGVCSDQHSAFQIQFDDTDVSTDMEVGLSDSAAPIMLRLGSSTMK